MLKLLNKVWGGEKVKFYISSLLESTCLLDCEHLDLNKMEDVEDMPHSKKKKKRLSVKMSISILH